jgi:hypothetical protein
MLRIRIFNPNLIISIPDPGLTRSASKILGIFYSQKTETKFLKIRSGMLIPDPGSGFFSIPDPEVKKASDLESGSATMVSLTTGPSLGLYILFRRSILQYLQKGET